MNITEATKRACEEPTLLDALTWICVWESERAIKQAKENSQWETCFRICMESVMEKLGVKNINILHNDIKLTDIKDEFGGGTLSTRILHSLEFKEITTLKQLSHLHCTELFTLNNVGIKSLKLIKGVLSRSQLDTTEVDEAIRRWCYIKGIKYEP